MLTLTPRISIRKGREWQLVHGHPWLFSGAISQAPKQLEPGTIVDLIDVDGQFVARGYYNPGCDIAVRVLTRDASETIDRAFLKRKFETARQLRAAVIDANQTNSFRLVNAEGDFLPGFIVDLYAGVAVVQSHTAGSDRLMPDFLDALADVAEPRAIIVRNDSAARRREGLIQEPPRIVSGNVPQPLLIKENGLSFLVDPLEGQKTGFFCDQRDKRAALARYSALAGPQAKLLNCFSYTCSFSVYASSSSPGLQSVNIDQSAAALDQARLNFESNKIDPAQHQFINADAFAWLEAHGSEHSFDIAVIDPPAFAKSHKEKNRALKAYTRINRLAMDSLHPGGLLLTCSCSGSIGLDEFEACLRDAGAMAGRTIQVLETHLNGADHPVNIAAPESRYLKAVLCRVN